MWKIIALILGFRAAYDYEENRLVVFGHGRHFYTWRDAVLSTKVEP